MEVLAALALTVVQAHLVEYLASEVETKGGLTAVQLGEHLALAALTTKLAIPGLAQPDLLEHADEELVDVVLDAARRLDELALARLRQLLALCESQKRGAKL